MAQSETEIIFSNENSGNSALYVYNQIGQHWTALLLPEGSSYTDPTISLQVAAQQQVYFLFAKTAPADAKTFIDSYRPYLFKFRQNVTANLTTAWLSNPDKTPSTQNTTVLNFAQFGTSAPFVVGQPFNVTIGNNFGTLSIQNNTVMTLQPGDTPNSLQLTWTSGSPNMSFANKTLGTNSLFRSDITIPFSGPGTGSFRFSLGLNLNLDFKGYGLQNNYYYGDGVNLSYFAYPILKTGDTNDYLLTQTEIDLLDIANSDGLNTYFAITGQIYNKNTNQTRAASLPSYYAINTGYALTFWPAVNMVDSGAQVNNLFPTDNSARFVISPQDAAGLKTYYLSPEGDFYLDPGASQAAFADENGQYSLLPGLSGTEVIAFTPYKNNNGTITGDTIRFKSKQAAFAANFPGQEVSLANPGTDKPVLDSTYLTAWANIASATPGNVQYASQPQGASLYAKDHGVASNNNITGFLGFYEPSVDMPQTNGFAVPLAPYLGVNPVPPPSAEGIGAFESKVLSAERKALISAAFTTPHSSKSLAKRTMAKTAATTYTASTTPQGLIANVNNDGSWSLLNLAQNTVNNGSPEYLNPAQQAPATPPQYQLSFINLMPQMQSAFLTNQQFLVMTNNQYLGDLFSTMNTPGGGFSSQPVFNNKMSIEDWPFDLNVGTSNTYADYNNVLIFKFCKGAIIDRVKNPKEWTQANAFNIDKDDADPDAAYNQLVAVSAWLQTYLQDAVDSYQQAKADPSSDQLKYYEKFYSIINDPNWNGILALKTTIDLQEFPQQLKGLISGINLSNFYAHHVGIEVNRVNATDTITMDPVSSLFGLINYVDPAYYNQVAQGQSENKPVPPAAGATYDFKVLFLQVLFENTAIKDFASKLQLTMNNLFSDSVKATNNPYGAANLNTIVLNGTYQDHNGTPVYVFENKYDNLFYFDSNLLQNVEITKIQFNTLTTDPSATDIQSRFTMWGYLNFGKMVTLSPATEDDPYPMDAFSFGLPTGSENILQFGLNYSNLYVNMAFNLSTPTVTTYQFDAGQIAFSSSQSNARTSSLYPNFALQINKLLSGNDDSLPSSQGYLTLSLPGVNANGLSGNWYGLQMTLNMGSPGELASNLGFNASLLVAWSPGSKTTDPGYNALVGIKLPGTSSNAKLLSLQGVLKLAIDKLSLQYVVDQDSYLLTLSNIALKLLGILKLPPGGNTNFLLFGNPNPGATAKSLGWYAAYNKDI
ncbi:hypothetical protein ACM46_10240 [Chryseobacterium angstadtii]|uniref:Uncharacterized protein n=1 Tax=Chryseobacterium angstadtii TaxID=558151 RepID=A0A0J7L6D6_9FLAO|nr:hypothetical protein [Chryseobacterium angstadtii]KMQ64620.1 hypothetical protein ACM46_10240 [Chryseobacterium angstadtii]